MSIARMLMRGSGSEIDPALSHVYMNGGDTVSYDNVRNINITTDTHRSGDILVAMTHTPSYGLLPGYTLLTSGRYKLGTYFLNRYATLQYKISDSSSETVSFSGYAGSLLSFANATTIGVVGSYQPVNDRAGLSVVPIPDLSELDTNGNAMIVACPGYGYSLLAADSPYSVSAEYVDSVAVIEKNTMAEISGKNFTRAETALVLSFAYELLP